MRLDIKPTHSKEFVFQIFIVGMLVMLAFNTNFFYNSIIATFVVAECLSIVPMFIWAIALEDRLLWPLKNQFAAFIYGDSLSLPAVAVGLAIIRHGRNAPALAESPIWLGGVAILAIVIGLLYRAATYPQTPPDENHCPTKLWHDLFTYPAFVFFLVSQAPILFGSPWHLSSIAPEGNVGWLALTLIIGGLVSWIWMSAAIVTRPAKANKQPHVAFSWIDSTPIEKRYGAL